MVGNIVVTMVVEVFYFMEVEVFYFMVVEVFYYHHQTYLQVLDIVVHSFWVKLQKYCSRYNRLGINQLLNIQQVLTLTLTY